MNDFQFEAFKIQLEKLEQISTEQAEERHQFLLMKSEELFQRCKYQNHDVKIFAGYLANIGKGIIPVPEVTEHCFPNYPKFSTYKDGSFHSGDYETWELWTLRKLDSEVMSKPKKIKIDRLIFLVCGGATTVFVTGYLVINLLNFLVINPVKNFANWWIEDNTIVSPWESGKANSYDYSRENLLRVRQASIECANAENFNLCREQYLDNK